MPSITLRHNPFSSSKGKLARIALSAALLMQAACAFAAHAAKQQPPAQQSQDAHDLQHATAAMDQAVIRNDAAGFAQYLAPQFTTRLGNSQEVYTREQYAAMLTKATSLEHIAQRKTRILSMRVIGSKAVLDEMLTEDTVYNFGGRPTNVSGSYPQKAIWVKTSAGWRQTGEQLPPPLLIHQDEHYPVTPPRKHNL